MGIPKAFTREKLVVGLIASGEERIPEALSRLSLAWGRADFASRPIPFDFTDYYRAEMGERLFRIFVSFEELVDPERLAQIKRETNSIENLFREGGLRRVNLDPGLLCLSRFVLATTKDSSHRIPLAQGIYAEVMLVFERGGFRPLEWTYPDYRSAAYLEILNSIRELYRRQVRGVWDGEGGRTVRA